MTRGSSPLQDHSIASPEPQARRRRPAPASRGGLVAPIQAAARSAAARSAAARWRLSLFVETQDPVTPPMLQSRERTNANGQPLPAAFPSDPAPLDWGGRRLETVLGKTLPPGDDYAESWELVDRGQDQSRVSCGPLRPNARGSDILARRGVARPAPSTAAFSAVVQIPGCATRPFAAGAPGR